MKKAYMILDLQYGSTGKGLLAGYLAKENKPDVVVTAWGPNAGHTYIDEDNNEYIHRMLANGIVSPNLKTVLIGPGSVIDMDCLKAEIVSCKHLMKGKTVVIHPQAVVVTQEHRDIEARNVKIGSTMKGTGAAVISRIERNPDANPTAGQCIGAEWMMDLIKEAGIYISMDEELYTRVLMNAETIQIEGAQGYSLSIYHGMYPYTTSRDVTPAQVLADCAIPYSIKPDVYGTLRTFPIRVSNRKDESGKTIGTSGPCYPDQRELLWSDLHREAELTTVTKLPRRIFTFSPMQMEEAFIQCGPTYLFLNFVNYLTREEARKLVDEIHSITRSKNGKNCHIAWMGLGPRHGDVIPFNEWDKVEV